MHVSWAYTCGSTPVGEKHDIFTAEEPLRRVTLPDQRSFHKRRQILLVTFNSPRTNVGRQSCIPEPVWNISVFLKRGVVLELVRPDIRNGVIQKPASLPHVCGAFLRRQNGSFDGRAFVCKQSRCSAVDLTGVETSHWVRCLVPDL